MEKLQKLLSDLLPWLDEYSTEAISYGLILIVVLVVLGSIPWALSCWRRRHRVPPDSVDLGIQVAQLPPIGPPSDGPELEFMHSSMRLAVAVFAPAGRTRDLPPKENWGELFDSIVPGLAEVAASHKPILHEWPIQLSTTGFTHRFYSEVKLPGNSGKMTPWCKVAGAFQYHGTTVLAGLVLCGVRPDRHSQYQVENENDWLGILRVRLEER
jgi:hypothetical protein